MKTILRLALAGLIIGVSANAYAFHSGGVADCDGCHTMHNSKEGQKMSISGSQFSGNAYLLQGSDQSSTCLNCHANTPAGSYHILTPGVAATNPGAANLPVNYTPGGDFGWLLRTYTWAGYEGNATEEGDRHGHNINAADFGISADSVQTAAPGGTYPNTALACSSCHDPHGRYRIQTTAASTAYTAQVTTGQAIWTSGSYGNLPKTAASGENLAVGVYRILGGQGYFPKSVGSSYAFTAAAPVAAAPSNYNRTESVTDTRVSYGTGMSEWCANCHGQIHLSTTYTSGATGLKHPADSGAKLTGGTLGNYNSYVASGNLTNTVSTSYMSLIPFEVGSQVLSTVAASAGNDGSKTAGADSSSNVMCLSCHRAHATGFASMTRWQNENEFIEVSGSWPGTDAASPANKVTLAMGRTMAESQAAYLDRPASKFSSYQRSLCNKCHAKD